jgi:UDP-2-acetamido-3-amino-2,3-dideoxy-glucuronate N-acetyltransferase
VKIAIVGYGSWGPQVLRSFSQVMAPKDLVVCEVRHERHAALHREHPRVALTPSWHSVLGDEAIHAIVLCTPAMTHFELAAQALKAGKHVLVETPFAPGVENASRLFAEARRHDRVVMAAHVFSHSRHILALRRLVAEGVLGRIRYLQSHRASLGPRPREEASVIWEYLVHDAYLLPLLVGRAPRHVWAHGGDYLRTGIPDVVFTAWDFGRGVLAACQASWYEPDEARRLCLTGSRRMAVFDDLREDARLLVYDRGYEIESSTDAAEGDSLHLYDKGAQAVNLEGEEPLVAQCRAFLRAVSQGRPPRGHRPQVMTTMAILEAVERSVLRGGAAVAVEGSPLEEAA